MTDQAPIEPSAVLAADGTRLPYRGDRSPAVGSQVARWSAPALIRAATSGPVLAATALTVAGVAAAKAAELTGRMAWEVARAAVERGRVPRAVPGWLEVSWTRVEIRWPG
jgi:hypothetical protein